MWNGENYIRSFIIRRLLHSAVMVKSMSLDNSRQLGSRNATGFCSENLKYKCLLENGDFYGAWLFNNYQLLK